MAVYRDISDPSIVVGCTECPWWFAMRFDLIEAYKAGEQHQIDVHEIEPARAQEPRRLFEQRAEKRARHAVTV
ncbi:hypothetical protein [Glaciibacter flavus]|uniref:hypothetical protein n=1 Tax=Orlajensenia flava TaxID=2565934 RepID=UPI003B000F35